MDKSADELTREMSAERLAEWPESGREFVSIVYGVAQAWNPAPVEQIFATAKALSVDVLSLADAGRSRSLKKRSIRSRANGWTPGNGTSGPRIDSVARCACSM